MKVKNSLQVQGSFIPQLFKRISEKVLRFFCPTVGIHILTVYQN